MSLINLRGHVEYRWNDDRAAKAFCELTATISSIWRIAAKHANRGQKDEIEAVRQRAHEAAFPLVRRANLLRRTFAEAVDKAAPI